MNKSNHEEINQVTSEDSRKFRASRTTVGSVEDVRAPSITERKKTIKITVLFTFG